MSKFSDGVHKVLIRWLGLLLISINTYLPAAETEAVEHTDKTGTFRLQSSLQQIYGESASLADQSLIPIDMEITWEIFVPESYDPSSPAGLLVYISPTASGQIKDDWKPLMAERNLIWVGANRSGNNTDTRRRVTYALLATRLVSERYALNRQRTWVSGFSGGGRVASYLATEYPQMFTGAIFICGVNFWGKNRNVVVENLRSSRFVFLTGSKDFNLRDTRNAYQQFADAGLDQIHLLVVPHMGHNMPRYSYYAQAIAWLDGETDE